MPAVSKKQAKLMNAVCNNPSFAQKVGIPQQVGCEFTESAKPTLTSYLIFEHIESTLTDVEFSSFIAEFKTAEELNENTPVSSSVAGAVYHRDYLKRKREKKSKRAKK